MVFKVENFVYNGFYVQSYPGLAVYTAEFEKWTNDPGIAICKCSDNETRLIPSCCLIGDKTSLPEQDLSNKKLFGQYSKS